MARGAGSRVIAFLLMGLFPLPASLARAWAPDPALGCACTQRACCCPPTTRATPSPCHENQGDAVPGPVVRCHHPSLDVLVPALPALVSPRVSAVVHPDESLVSSPRGDTPRLGFGRIESPPPRSNGSA